MTTAAAPTTAAEPFFNYYSGNIKDSAPKGLVTLSQFFQAIQNPKPSILELLDQIRVASRNKDEALRAKLKTQLYSFTPCVRVRTRRAYCDIQAFTGLLVLDFDKLEENHAQELKYELFETHPFIIATWLSASKRGCRALVNIPIVRTPKEFKEYFIALELMHMKKYAGYDSAPKNPVLPLFLSHDPDILFGDTTAQWDMKYNPPPPPPAKHFKSSYLPTMATNYAINKINRIVDNGHPQLRAAAYKMGGYVAVGHITEQEAISLMDELIDGNAYLREKADVYKTTSRTMITEGQKKPLYL